RAERRGRAGAAGGGPVSRKKEGSRQAPPPGAPAGRGTAERCDRGAHGQIRPIRTAMIRAMTDQRSPVVNAVALVGGGLMGSGIAAVLTAAGYRVSLFDPSSEAR